MNKKLNILICPLEWGLGHAGRMIPIARKLKETGNEVIIGGGTELHSFFREELPGLTFADFPGFRPKYSRILPQYLVLLFRVPVLVFHIISEHFRLKRIIDDYSIDLLISDNRFGLWNKGIKTVYVTHQLRIPFPPGFRFLEWIGVLLHGFFIKRFDYCFIPDLPGDINLSGRMSHGVKLLSNIRFIGVLSRFVDVEEIQPASGKNFRYNLVILSGPEPQKGILRQKLIKILKDNEHPTLILEGRPSASGDPSKAGNIISYNHLSSARMKGLINSGDNLITRAGYTVIMELVTLNRSALLIPTPGQTEQEYLAAYLKEKGWFEVISQGSLNKTLPLPVSQNITAYFFITESKKLLDRALEEVLGFRLSSWEE